MHSNGMVLTFPKWDFGGDKSHTNKIWNDILNELRSLKEDAFPLSILDLDKEDEKMVIVRNQNQFEIWMKNEFGKF